MFGMASSFYNDEQIVQAGASLAGIYRTLGGMTPVAGGAMVSNIIVAIVDDVSVVSEHRLNG